MFKAIFKAIFGFVQFAANRIRAWIPQVAASLILFGYLEDALQAMLQLRMHAHHMAMLMNGWETIGVIYMLLDIAIILTGTVLIGCSCNCNDGSGNGVAMLWLQRTLRTLAFSIWDYELLLHYCVDVGCLLLLLLAMRQSQRQATAGVCWQHDRQQQRSLQRLLSVARIGMCCVCLLWIVEPHQIINKPFAVACFILMLLGIRCKLLASLMIAPLLWQANGSLIWGWNDLTISLQFISSMLSKVAGLLLLTRLGGGKWSLDALINRTTKSPLNTGV
ncbi:uncharacterized protein LOC117565758 isoform X2 [Drosophila albomicans]|uniref:Uncharacterized protein LOC117565758 isoform X2 n=1 Tax=Drosophila albomicans TaxID=7291 RepID=A0A6P8XSR7_DROAB|nr:uncharacterized protein LOC117565758 isoform X2 [Drosophila albomicans]